MHHTLVPISQPRLHLALTLFHLAILKLVKEKPDLLPKRMKRLPPMRTTVLVSVPGEDVVEEGVDVM